MGAESKVLEEREKYGQEELPEGAHKANKHYKPWENPMPNASATILGGDTSTGSSEKKTGSTAPAASTGKNEIQPFFRIGIKAKNLKAAAA